MSEMMLLDSTQRIALAIEYDGSRFHGWQRQLNAASVQQSVEDALSKIEGQSVSVFAAGRTDAGVHARAMLAHADVSLNRWTRSRRAYTQGLNQLLPPGVVITGVQSVNHDFHARFDCIARCYRYQIWSRNTPTVLASWRHWWIPRKLDDIAMQDAAELLLGVHDFSTFRSSGCQAKSTIKTMAKASVIRQGYEILLDFEADAFLYHMVRSMVGCLVQVGYGRWSINQFKDALESKDRAYAATMAPPQGLYFMNARYAALSSQQLIGSCD